VGPTGDFDAFEEAEALAAAPVESTPEESTLSAETSEQLDGLFDAPTDSPSNDGAVKGEEITAQGAFDDPTGSPSINITYSAELLPPARVAQSPIEQDFHASAARAVQRVQHADHDDPADLEQLQQRLLNEPELIALIPAWEAPVAQALERAYSLQEISGPHQAIVRAFYNARVDPSSGRMTGIDTTSCRDAFELIYLINEDAILVEMSVPNVGRRMLAEIEVLCKDAVVAGAPEFPQDRGPRKLRKLARKAYKKAYPGHRLLNLAVIDGWKLEGKGRTRTLDLLIGRDAPTSGSSAACVLEKVRLEQFKKRKKFSRTRCCNVIATWNVACEDLE